MQISQKEENLNKRFIVSFSDLKEICIKILSYPSLNIVFL